MGEALFVAGSVLIPLGFGLIPAFLPRDASTATRWALWLGLVALAGGYVHLLRQAAGPYPALALVFLILSASLSLIVLIVETNRHQGPRRRA